MFTTRGVNLLKQFEWCVIGLEIHRAVDVLDRCWHGKYIAVITRQFFSKNHDDVIRRKFEWCVIGLEIHRAVDVLDRCWHGKYIALITRQFFFKNHDDVIRWNLFPRYWPLVWRIHQSPVNSPHKGPVMRNFMFVWCGSAYTDKHTVEWPVIWDCMTFTWRYNNVYQISHSSLISVKKLLSFVSSRSGHKSTSVIIYALYRVILDCVITVSNYSYATRHQAMININAETFWQETSHQ